ncbi:MAG: hypothetical protein H6625_14145 [Bdellovibrionaceae bacterium]|nr:hypothetical protein [Pseudobdellovibrionaceae bacterium]
MVWLTVVIGIFLFYQFVPRIHKILLFKLFGGLIILTGIFVGAVSLYNEWDNEQRKKWKTVRFQYLKDSDKKGKKELAIEICNNRKDSDLLKYEIYVTGFNEGRSTEMKIYKQYDFEEWEGNSSFKSDIIVKKDSCTNVVWTGNFRTYDRYDVKSYNFYDKWSY